MDFLAGAIAAVVAIALALGVKRSFDAIKELRSQVDDIQVALSDIAGKGDE